MPTATKKKTVKKAAKATNKSPVTKKGLAKAKAKPAKTKKAGVQAKTTKKAPAQAAQVTSKAKLRKASEPERSSPPLAKVDADVLEFIAAIDEFKKVNGRPFPSWSEVLLVVRQLGYRRA